MAAAVILAVCVWQFIPRQSAWQAPADAASLSDGSPAFMQELAVMTRSRVETGDAVEPIPAGADFQSALLSAINSASSSIMMTDFPWDGGDFTHSVFLALTAAAERGVTVRVLLDGFGGRTVPEEWIDGLRQAGGKVSWYHTFNILDPLQYDVRDHARSFVFDGRLAFTGGIGFVDYWVKNADGYDTWRDLMFAIRGNMADSLESDFAKLWKSATGEVLDTRLSGATTPRAATASSSDGVDYISIFGKPSLDFQPDRYAFLMTALGARKKLYIESAYIVPDSDLIQILEDKARAGVDVRIISPGPVTSAPILRSAWHTYFSGLLSAGVKLYEYQPTMIHSKIMVADDLWSLVGSANVDDRSESINVESVLGISDAALAKSLDDIFMNDVAQSKQIELRDWQNQYGFFDKLQSDFWLLFKRQE